MHDPNYALTVVLRLWPAPATLSSTCCFDNRRQDADMDKSAGFACVWTQGQSSGRHNVLAKETQSHAVCTSRRTGKMFSSKNYFLEGHSERICYKNLELHVFQHLIVYLEDGSRALSQWLYLHHPVSSNRRAFVGLLLLQHVSSHTIGSAHRCCLSWAVHMATPLHDLKSLLFFGAAPRI